MIGRMLDRARGRDGDAGMTLAELLVVSLVSMILLSAVGTLVASSLAASRETTAHTAATAEARFAMDVVARRLRVAVRPTLGDPIFTHASPTSVEFYASLGAAGSTDLQPPSLVRYEVDTASNCLRETITPAVAPVRSTCLARGQVTPAFRYYRVTKPRTRANPSPSPEPTEALVPGSTGSLDPLDADRVASVEIGLGVRDPREPDRSVDVSTRVLLVNHHHEPVKDDA